MADCRCGLAHPSMRDWEYHSSVACGRTLDHFARAHLRAARLGHA